MVIVDTNTDFKQVKSHNCFVIEFSDNETLSTILSKIKKDMDVEIYAKPILLFNRYDVEIEDYFAQCVDKVVDKKYMEHYEYDKDVMISNINGKINILKNLEVDQDLALKILRYVYCRNDTLDPYPSLKNRYGYTYPKIDHMLSTSNGGQLFEALDFLEKQKLFEPVFYDKCHFCKQCYSAFLNFKEVCPRCFSVNIDSEPLIHHFECAYVGLEHEFIQGKKMVCPKCDKELFHIGVDYDKPSFVYTCNKCNNEFQDPLVQGSCFNCKSTFDIDNLILRNIYQYGMTVLAENSAMFGFSSLFQMILDDSLEILPPHIFDRYVDVEIARIRRYKKSVSTLVSLNLNDFNRIYSDVNSLETIKKIFTSLAQVIKDFLRTTDVLTTFNDVSYGILLTETPLSGAEIATGRLKEKIEELIRVNINKDYKINLKLLEMTPDTTMEEIKGFFE